MRGKSVSLDLLIDSYEDVTIYLEKDSIEPFINWLGTKKIGLLLSGTWDIRVLKHQISIYRDYLSRRRKLTSLGITVLNDNLLPSDTLFVDEVEHTYFSSNPSNSRQLAEYYVLIRRIVGNGWINIISQDFTFERIPYVNTYFAGTQIRTGTRLPPAQFDFLQDLDIHPSLVRRVANSLNGPEYSIAVLEAIIELQDYLKDLTGLSADGRSLMEAAFRQDGRRLKLNPLTSIDQRGTQHNEQKGFRELYCGTITGLRNPLSHKGTGSNYAKVRFPNQVTMYKYLCFLSILFERANPPFP